MLLLYLHRTATTGQLAELLTPEAADPSYLRRVLRATAAAGLIDFVHADSAQQKVWFLSRAGYAMAEASGDVFVRSHRMTPALAKGALLAHRLATVDVGAAFVRAARQHPGDGCTPWHWEPAVALQPGFRGGGLIVDAVLEYERAQAGGGFVPYMWLLEIDRGTSSVAQLTKSLHAYAMWWRASQQRYTPYSRARCLLVVFDMPAPAAERRLNALIDSVRAIPELVDTHGPHLRIGGVASDALGAAGPWAKIITNVLGTPPALVDATLEP